MNIEDYLKHLDDMGVEFRYPCPLNKFHNDSNLPDFFECLQCDCSLPNSQRYCGLMCRLIYHPKEVNNE